MKRVTRQDIGKEARRKGHIKAYYKQKASEALAKMMQIADDLRIATEAYEALVSKTSP